MQKVVSASRIFSFTPSNLGSVPTRSRLSFSLLTSRLTRLIVGGSSRKGVDTTLIANPINEEITASPFVHDCVPLSTTTTCLPSTVIVFLYSLALFHSSSSVPLLCASICTFGTPASNDSKDATSRKGSAPSASNWLRFLDTSIVCCNCAAVVESWQNKTLGADSNVDIVRTIFQIIRTCYQCVRSVPNVDSAQIKGRPLRPAHE